MPHKMKFRTKTPYRNVNNCAQIMPEERLF
jgi:hypothetical protein